MSTARKTSSISVIIPALNEEAALPATLAALTAEEAEEIIVVDGGSSDATTTIARQGGARVVTSPPGRGLQMNAGAAAASGAILFFLHADTIPPPGFARELRRLLEDPGVIAGAFRLAIEGNHPGLRCIEFGANLRARLLGLPYGDQGLFVRERDFHGIGGFRNLPLCEDLDMVRRLRRRGRIRLSAKTVRTSARRWQRLGLLRTTWRNQLVLLGFRLGVAPELLARWYRR